jgi:predicted phage baseplate assembly protein
VTIPGGRLPGFDELGIADPGGRQRSERGRILPPDLDDRRWQDLVDEASELIKRSAPQWTDHSPSDIGMTIVELFAWLTESLIYRLNRVPEKNYIAFLNLLGMTRAPARPARTLLTFTAAGTPVVVPERTPVQTPGSETDSPIVFETDAELTVVAATPVGAVRVDHPGNPDDAGYTPLPVDPSGREPATIEIALPDGASVQVCLALKAAAPPAEVALYVEPFRPPIDRRAGERIEWTYSRADGTEPFGWGPFELVQDGTAGLVRPGVVRLRVPGGGPPWGAQDPQSADAGWSLDEPLIDEPGAHLWLGLRLTNDPAARPTGTTPGPLQLRLDRLLVNTTTAASVSTVVDERLGTGTGKPQQVLRLAHYPLYARPGTDSPYDHAVITVAGTPWQAVQYLADGAGNRYVLDPTTGEVAFGDHDPASGRGGGTVPAAGQEILATYRYVATAAAANVAPGLVTLLTRGPTGLTAVTNPTPALGGVDEEPIEETNRRAPQVLRHRDRAVTADDYELLARSAAPGIAIARCLPPRLQTTRQQDRWEIDDPWTYGNLQRAPGVVNVIIVPDLGSDVAEPTPSLAMVQDVVRVLDRRRPVGTALHVTGPRYVPVKVVARIEVFRSAIDQGLVESAQAVQRAIERTIRTFLDPVRGGRRQQGWQVGESVYVTDVYRAIQLPAEVGYVNALWLVPQRPRYFVGTAAQQRPIADALEDPPLADVGTLQTNQVRVADYELVCCGNLVVAAAVSA